MAYFTWAAWEAGADAGRDADTGADAATAALAAGSGADAAAGRTCGTLAALATATVAGRRDRPSIAHTSRPTSTAPLARPAPQAHSGCLRQRCISRVSGFSKTSAAA